MTVTGSVRFLVGAALVAAGGTLVAPLVTKLAAEARAPGYRAVNAPPGGAPPAVTPPAAATALNPPQAAGESAAPVDPWWAAVPGPAAVDSAGGLQLDRCPPPPPTPLPPPPHELALASPALAGAYRSTLQVPPPQLLDATGPPPAVAAWAAPAAAPPTPARAAREITVPETYRVRDGDDLGAIAGRFYGDTAAAPAIWAANRTTVPNPDLLPIGAELLLPPPWAVQGLRRPGAGSIEPVAYARPTASPAARDAGPTPHAVPWLAPAADIPAPAAFVPAPAAAMPVPSRPVPSGPVHAVPAAGATSVRVGNGETLVSVARRLYGDPAMAEQIFAANRDRLRSPDLVVAGMELRLPRPVTAPRS